MPSGIRPAFAALWALDCAFADVVSSSTDPRLGAIRLAWWREQLEKLDAGTGAPSEPRLQAAQRALLPLGIRGSELSQLEDAWLPLLEPFSWSSAQSEGLRLRGRILFGVGARLLGSDDIGPAGQCGELWSLEDAARYCSDDLSRTFLLDEAARALPRLPHRIKPRLRPMTILTAVAACDIRPTVMGRGFAALRHRLTGHLPHHS